MILLHVVPIGKPALLVNYLWIRCTSDAGLLESSGEKLRGVHCKQWFEDRRPEARDYGPSLSKSQELETQRKPMA